MATYKIVAGAAGIVTFFVAEAVCRLLLHIADDIVPLVVCPLTAVVDVAMLAVGRRRGAE